MMAKKREKSKEQKQALPKDSELEKLYEEIEALQKEKDEIFEKLQRVSADYSNFQKRAPKQIADSVAYEKELVIKTLLPALDNFEHTLQNAHSVEKIDDIIKGVRIIYDQMLSILKSHGVEQILATGETFDPALHEAMMRKSIPEQQENIVLEEFQKGYKLNGRVIRPSKVVVNMLQPQQQPQELISDEDEQEQNEIDSETAPADESEDMEQE